MFDTRIIAALEERHYTSKCLYAHVVGMCPSPHTSDVLLVELDPVQDVRRTLVVRGQGIEMFPLFLIGRRIAVMCRPQLDEAYFSQYGFTALADVEKLTEQEADLLWRWRREALECLCDERFQMTQFELELCDSMSSRGTPPALRQRRLLRQTVRQRAVRPPKATLETMDRAARYDIARRGGGPAPLGDAIAELIEWMMKAAGGPRSAN
ncbi:MAG: hypothetical protein ABR613_02585 [Actinomycetota bacterium]